MLVIVIRERKAVKRSARGISVSVLGCLLARWSKKYLSARSPSWLGLTVCNEVMSIVKMNGKLEIAKSFERMISVFDT